MVARNRNQGQNWTNQQNSGGSPSFDSDETDWRTTAKKALKMGSDWPDKVPFSFFSAETENESSLNTDSHNFWYPSSSDWG